VQLELSVELGFGFYWVCVSFFFSSDSRAELETLQKPARWDHPVGWTSVVSCESGDRQLETTRSLPELRPPLVRSSLCRYYPRQERERRTKAESQFLFASFSIFCPLHSIYLEIRIPISRSG
jgi:hypothetical protein